MSAIFQRPLCQMGAAYDFAFRPIVGDPDPGSGGPCDDRPRAVELTGAGTEPPTGSTGWRTYELCPEHEEQLRTVDRRLCAQGARSRFRRDDARPTRPPGPTR